MPEFDVARDDMLGVFVVKWNADAPAVNGGTAPQIFYDGVGDSGPPDDSTPYCRIQVRHTAGSNAGIGGPPGERVRTEKAGLVTVQVFTPLFNDDGSARGTQLAENLSKIAKAAFETVVTENGVIFRNVRPVEVGVDGPWYQINVLAEFEYDEFV